MDAPVQTPIDPTEPTVTQAEEVGSLAEFAEKYAGKSEPNHVDDDEPPAPRDTRRARRTDDHETISVLTKRLREAEAQIGVNTERLDGESDRAFNLRLRAEAAEAVAKKATERREEAKPVYSQPLPAPSAFGEAEPTIEQFKDAPDPYTAWVRASSAYDRRKEAFDAQQKQIGAMSEERLNAARGLRQAAEQKHFERIETFKKSTPDYNQIVGAAKEWPATPLMQIALVNDPNGEKYIYELAKNRSLYNRFLLDSDGKVVTRETVEAFQELLKERMPAVTGSAHTPAIVNYPPPPPNPVRTGRMRSGPSSEPNPENMSMAQFDKNFPSKRRH